MSELSFVFVSCSISMRCRDTNRASQAREAGSTPVSRSSIDNQQLTSFFIIKNIAKSTIFAYKIGTKTCIICAKISNFVSNM